jgi:[acyl-carrier-protein] S-malonyltransferase
MVSAFLFPGQGSQAVGMGRALAESMPAARAVFEEVDEALGTPLSRVIFDGPEETLRLTENAQPALMATSLAALRGIEATSGRELTALAGFVAGHSLGEYSALAAAGALSIGDAARLLRLRGRAMQSAVPVGEGAMAAILGLELAEVEAVALEAGAGEVCDVANDNAPGQVVVSGARDAVARAVEIAKGKGAKRSLLLPVSAPFHCRLMAPAAEAVAAALADIEMQTPAVPVITNVGAAPESRVDALKQALIEQVTARVRWRESLLAMPPLGIDRLVEIGAGKVLAGLAKRTIKEMPAVSVGDPEGIEALVAAAGERQAMTSSL